MGTGSGSSGNNRGDNRNSGGKTVRKVQNSRFYERENPEGNLRRVGRTASEFDESRRTHTTGYGSDANKRDSQTGDNIPEYKSFKTKRSIGSIGRLSKQHPSRNERNEFSLGHIKCC